MKYNTNDLFESKEAITYLQRLIENKSIVEIKKIAKNRSLNQNNYLHLLLGAFGQHFGYTLEESKEIYKRLNKDIYAYTKTDRTFWKSSADISTEEMAKSINKFMEFSASNGYPLPLATDTEALRRLENDIERNKYYL